MGDQDVMVNSVESSSLDILPVKKEAKLSASEVPGEVVGSGEEDLRCRSLLTVCQRRLGLSEAEDTRLEKYSFFGRQDELVINRLFRLCFSVSFLTTCIRSATASGTSAAVPSTRT